MLVIGIFKIYICNNENKGIAQISRRRQVRLPHHHRNHHCRAYSLRSPRLSGGGWMVMQKANSSPARLLAWPFVAPLAARAPRGPMGKSPPALSHTWTQVKWQLNFDRVRRPASWDEGSEFNASARSQLNQSGRTWGGNSNCFTKQSFTGSQIKQESICRCKKIRLCWFAQWQLLIRTGTQTGLLTGSPSRPSLPGKPLSPLAPGCPGKPFVRDGGKIQHIVDKTLSNF